MHSQVVDGKGVISNKTQLGDLIIGRRNEQRIRCMLKVISREFVGIWLAGPTQTVLVSNQQCGQSPAVDGKIPYAYAAKIK